MTRLTAVPSPATLLMRYGEIAGDPLMGWNALDHDRAHRDFGPIPDRDFVGDGCRGTEPDVVANARAARNGGSRRNPATLADFRAMSNVNEGVQLAPVANQSVIVESMSAILHRLIDLELEESGYKDPVLRERWQQDLGCRFAPDLDRFVTISKERDVAVGRPRCRKARP